MEEMVGYYAVCSCKDYNSPGDVGCPVHNPTFGELTVSSHDYASAEYITPGVNFAKLRHHKQLNTKKIEANKRKTVRKKNKIAGNSRRLNRR